MWCVPEVIIKIPASIVIKNALSITHDIGIFGFCGMEVIRKEIFHEVPFITDEERKKMLEKI